MRLINKTIIKGKIKLETGLHIGGSKASLDIGGLDSPVIKSPIGVPYIPGSSLKGKLRSLIAKKINGAEMVDNDDNKVKKLFGYHGKKGDLKKGIPEKPAFLSRLIVRDAELDKDAFSKTFPEGIAVLDTEFTQEKYENTINRKSGKAAHGGVRNIERVPAGAVFNFELVLNNYEEDKNEDFISLIKQGFALLEDDYLGGSGTRGYGKVTIDSNIDNLTPNTY